MGLEIENKFNEIIKKFNQKSNNQPRIFIRSLKKGFALSHLNNKKAAKQQSRMHAIYININRRQDITQKYVFNVTFNMR